MDTVPQRYILWPVLFNTFISNLKKRLSSRMRKFFTVY